MVVEPGQFPGQDEGQDVGAVQGRDGDQVEQGQEDVDADAEVGQLHEARVGQTHAQDDGKERGQDQIAHRPGGAHGKLAPAVIAIVQGVHRHRLGPAEQDAGVGEQQQERQDDGPHRVDVGHRVEGDAAQHPGGGVAV